MDSRRIVRNAARCKLCGDEIESTHRWDYRACRCGALAVDGGRDYVKRVWHPSAGPREDAYEDLTVWAEAV